MRFHRLIPLLIVAGCAAWLTLFDGENEHQTSAPLIPSPTAKKAATRFGQTPGIQPAEAGSFKPKNHREALHSPALRPDQQQLPIVASGRVTSLAGNPIADAYIELLPLTPTAIDFTTWMTTDSTGTFKLQGETDATQFALRVTCDDHQTHTSEPFATGTLDQEIVLVATGSLSGSFASVIDESVPWELTLVPTGSVPTPFFEANTRTSTPHHALAEYARYEEPPFREFTFEGVPHGLYDLHIYSARSHALAQSIHAVRVPAQLENDERLVDINPYAGLGSIVITFTTDGSTAAPTVTVLERHERDGNPVWRLVDSSAFGEVTLHMIAPTAHLLVMADGYQAQVIPDVDRDIEIHLAKAAPILVKLAAADEFKHFSIFVRATRLLDAPQEGVLGGGFTQNRHFASGNNYSKQVLGNRTVELIGMGPGEYDLHYYIAKKPGTDFSHMYTTPSQRIQVTKNQAPIQLLIDPKPIAERE